MHSAAAEPDASPSNADGTPGPAPGFHWLTPSRCRLLLAVTLLVGFVGHLVYLTSENCPIDLSGDEAHYWDWSRQLDLSYYSKGPLVAYVIRASCAGFGRDTMWAVRFPALVLAVGTGVVTYLLTRKLFRSERLALGAVLLNAMVPMFIAGSLLMTIDPPFFFCWALATYLLAQAMFDGRRWCWPAIGVVVGVGFLAKYAMYLWLPAMLLALWADRPSGRRLLRTPGPWIAIVIALLFATPVILWNARHDWVSLRHVATQTGTGGGGKFDPMSFPAFIGGQIGVLGPAVAVLMVGACAFAWSRARAGATPPEGDSDDPGKLAAEPRVRETTFLFAVGVPFFVLTALTSFLAKVQPNWPAPAYFTLLILTAYFIATRAAVPPSWKRWRPWVYAAVVTGVVATPLAHHTEWLYPFIRWQHQARGLKGVPEAGRIDPVARLKGWAEQGRMLNAEIEKLGPGAFVLCDDYQKTAEAAFYLPGQPKTYCAGSYFSKPKRHTQYDVWLDRALEADRNPGLLGRDAVYVGFVNPDVVAAFERIEGPFSVDVLRAGVRVFTFRYTRCFGFKGMTRPAGRGKS